jgi:hypothetical protein
MDIALAILGGMLCKIYDDFSDSKIVTNPLVLECLKGLQWISLCLLSYKDFNFSFVFYLGNLLNSISNPIEWTPAYEHSLLILYPIFLIMSYTTFQYPNIYDLILAFCNCVGMLIEPYLITEEYSYKKLASRFMLLFMFLICLALPLSLFFHKVLGYGIGYFLASCAYQGYRLLGA